MNNIIKVNVCAAKWNSNPVYFSACCQHYWGHMCMQTIFHENRSIFGYIMTSHIFLTRRLSVMLNLMGISFWLLRHFLHISFYNSTRFCYISSFLGNDLTEIPSCNTTADAMLNVLSLYISTNFQQSEGKVRLHKQFCSNLASTFPSGCLYVDHKQNKNLCMYLYLRQHGRTSAYPRLWSPDRSWRFGTIYCFRRFYDKGVATHIPAAYLTEWNIWTWNDVKYWNCGGWEW